MQLPVTKLCRLCDHTLPVEAFKRQWKLNSKGEKRPNGWSYLCKSCISFKQTEKNRALREDDPGKPTEAREIASLLRFAIKHKDVILLNQIQDKMIAICAENPENPIWNGLFVTAFHLKNQNFSCQVCDGPLPSKPCPDYVPGTENFRALLCIPCKNRVTILSKYTQTFLAKVAKYRAFHGPDPEIA
jgi:hypothetical protein